MALDVGTRLGPYQIDAPLGAGGMGEVYKATDTRLDRTVAIKVLPEHVAGDPDLKQRFEREARTVAALNHPHICTLHDIGNQDGIDFLVMEYLDGETLGQRLEKGALPLDQALQIAIEIVDALDKAHRQGIVHRDLKPGNIMLTKAGAKLLDFGLAKLRKPGTVGTEGFSAATTTQSGPLTERGMLLGTLPYMAPEQVEGKEADARSDIFSFGTIAYEMLTGHRPFGGESQASLIADIMHVEPPAVSAVQPLSPLSVDRVVATCLAKNPDERWQTATDLKREIRWVTEASVAADQAASAATVKTRRVAVAWGAGAAAALVLVGALGWQLSRSDTISPPIMTRTTITLPGIQQLSLDGGADPLAISPDGSRVAYAAYGDGGLQLYLRELDAFDARPLPGTEGAQYPFFSADGSQIAFFADGKLQRLPVSGGAAIPVCEVETIGRAGTWGSDGTIVFGSLTGLWRVDAAGGTPERIVSRDPEMDAQGQGYPRFLPGSRGIVSTVYGLPGFEPSAVAVLDLESGEWNVVGVGVQGQYLQSGHLVYHAGAGEEGELHAVAFDLDEMIVRGAPASVLEGVFRARNGGAAYYDVAENGTLVFAPGGHAHTLVRVDQGGGRTPLSEDRLGFRFPQLSPDGRRVAVTIDPRPSEIWVYDLDRGTRNPLATDGHSIEPAWTADGRRVAYRYQNNIYWRAADGSTPAQLLLQRPTPELGSAWSPMAWSSNGDWFLFMGEDPQSGWDVWARYADGEPALVLMSPADEMLPSLSPDGRWLAYSSDESGRQEVYVQPFPDVAAGRWTISADGGHTPIWSPDGTRLFYMRGTEMMAVPIIREFDRLTAGVPEALFDGPFDRTQDGNYDVFPDGDHFLMVEVDPDAEPSRLHLVLNWFEELKARVPTN
jgi:serine/threonine-protein kinase